MPPQRVNVFGSDVEDVHFMNGTLDTVYGLKLYDPKINPSMVSKLARITICKSFNNALF